MIKRILKNWYRYILWALLSAIFWTWIFTLLFTAPPKKKVVLYADLPAIDGNSLSIALEENLPEGIRMVEVSVFDDLIFNASSVLSGDLYLIPESRAETYLPSFTEIDRAAFPGETFYESDGKAYGILVYDEASNLRIGGKRVFYLQGERCYLFFNAKSIHIGDPDDAAFAVAGQFLTLREQEKADEKEMDRSAADDGAAAGLHRNGTETGSRAADECGRGRNGNGDRDGKRDSDGKDRRQLALRKEGRGLAGRLYYGYGRVVGHFGRTERRTIL